jgi:hypothetical protein
MITRTVREAMLISRQLLVIRKRFHKRSWEDSGASSPSAICLIGPGKRPSAVEVFQLGLVGASRVDTVTKFTVLCGKRFHA